MERYHNNNYPWLTYAGVLPLLGMMKLNVTKVYEYYDEVRQKQIWILTGSERVEEKATIQVPDQPGLLTFSVQKLYFIEMNYIKEKLKCLTFTNEKNAAQMFYYCCDEHQLLVHNQGYFPKFLGHRSGYVKNNHFHIYELDSFFSSVDESLIGFEKQRNWTLRD